MTAISTPVHAPPDELGEKLSRLRRKTRIWLVADGLARALTIVAAILAFDLLVDWYFRMDRAQRIVCFVLMGAAIAHVVYWRLIHPLRQPLGDDMLALEVERRRSDLGQSVISAIQFSRELDRVESLGLSSTMVEATIQRGRNAAASVDFSEVLDANAFRRNVLIGAIWVLAAAGFVLAVPNVAQTWANRNLMLGDAQWPQDTHLRVINVGDDGQITLPRGDDLILEVEIEHGKVPDDATVDYRTGRSGWDAQTMTPGERVVAGDMVKIDDEKKPRFRYTFKNVLEEFELRIRAGDARTEPIQVRLVERPVVDKLELRLSAPAYMQKTAKRLPRGEGPYDVYPGSRLSIVGAASKDLKSAQLRIVVAGAAPDLIPLTLSPNQPKSFSAELDSSKLRSAAYQIEVIDVKNRRNKRPEDFTLQLRTDRAPDVRAALSGVSTIIVSRARIPISVKLRDDFSIAASRLVYRLRTPGDPPQETPGEQSSADVVERFGPATLEFTQILDAQEFELPVGADVELLVEAKDNDDVSGPNVGESQKLQVRVVSEEELRTDLLRREREQQRQFKDLAASQIDLTTDVRALRADLSGKPLDAVRREQLLKLQKRQHQAAARCDTVADWLEMLAVEAENNRLEGPEGRYQQIMRGKIVAPLRRLADKLIPQAVDQLDAARRTGDDDAKGAADRLAEGVASQIEISAQMEEILRYMAKSEGYQEAINLIYRAIDVQRSVREETEKKATGQ